MFLAFNPLLLLLWIFLICFVPGVLLSFSIFRKSDLLAVEKVLTGFALGIIILPLIPFLLYLFLGIKYSYVIAEISVVLFYAIATALFIRSKAYTDFVFQVPSRFVPSREMVLSLLIGVIVVVVFLARLSTYSPIFMELDPYYYSYIPQQILVFGENPFNDKTAWFPDEVVSHRLVPDLSYLEALWYSFYTGGGAYDNMLLAVITSVYPPIAAGLAVFFLYMLISSFYKREWGLLAAGIAAFIPVFLMKTLAGEMEVQPFAFFSLAFFFSMYARMIIGYELRYTLLAALGFIAVTLGSNSGILAIGVMLIFIPLQSIFYFLKDKDESRLKQILINNSIILVFGVLLFGGIIKELFFAGMPSISDSIPLAIILLFSTALYAMRKFLPAETGNYIFVGLILVGLVLFFFSPLGDAIKRVGEAGIGFARFNAPLDRTIAEQNPAGSSFSGEFGFIATGYPKWLDFLLGWVSDLVNAAMAVMVWLVNIVLDTSIEYGAKDSSLLMLWIFIFGLMLVYSLARLIKGESAPVLLIAAIVFPPVLVGFLKAKYTIYAGFLLAVAIGFIFGETEDMIKRLSASVTKNEEASQKLASYGYIVLAVVAALLVVLEFSVSASGLSPALLSSEISKVRFQDDPSALSAKFQSMCSQVSAGTLNENSICSMYGQGGLGFCTVYDSPICSVAADPVAYANQGTNQQYNRKLCFYSLISDISNPKREEILAAQFRCERISEYWIESMEWIKNSTEHDSRTTSWWDYGHWINFFGQKNTVLRNEHVSKLMIGEVAHSYVDGTPEDLIQFMRSRNSSYALFDRELVGTGSLGGKYGALNYLQCARDNQTNVSFSPIMSQCEADHLWETVFIPSDPGENGCVISKSGNKTGIIAYKAYWTWDQQKPFIYTPSYPYISIYPGYYCAGGYLSNPNTLSVCRNLATVRPAYCVGQVLMASGETTYGTYLLNETYPNGDLRLNKAFLEIPEEIPGTLHMGNVTSLTLFYSNDPVWLENGQVTSGYGDRGSKFYSSNIYRALFMNDLPGFRKVFESKDKTVTIYKIED